LFDSLATAKHSENTKSLQGLRGCGLSGRPGKGTGRIFVCVTGNVKGWDRGCGISYPVCGIFREAGGAVYATSATLRCFQPDRATTSPAAVPGSATQPTMRCCISSYACNIRQIAASRHRGIDHSSDQLHGGPVSCKFKRLLPPQHSLSTQLSRLPHNQDQPQPS